MNSLRCTAHNTATLMNLEPLYCHLLVNILSRGRCDQHQQKREKLILDRRTRLLVRLWRSPRSFQTRESWSLLNSPCPIWRSSSPSQTWRTPDGRGWSSAVSRWAAAPGQSARCPRPLLPRWGRCPVQPGILGTHRNTTEHRGTEPESGPGQLWGDVVWFFRQFRLLSQL